MSTRMKAWVGAAVGTISHKIMKIASSMLILSKIKTRVVDFFSI